VLNALALGGHILILHDDDARVIDIECYTREGWVMSDCSLGIFKRLRARKLVASSGGGPYRITRLGLEALRT